MSKHTVFKSLKKYRFFTIILALLLLAGCGSINEPIGANSTGFFDHYFVYTFSLLIKKAASLAGGNYGFSIIFVTIIIRLILMPLMLKQAKGGQQTKEKMKVLKPEIDAIQAKYKQDKFDKEAQGKLQQEMVQLYQKHNFNPIASIGCLPMIIQFPILIGFYYAIRRTPEIAAHSFLWFNLGQADLIMPFIAAAIYFIQFKVSQIGMDAQQRKQMALLGLLSPIMIGVVSFTAPAALPLYWAVGGVFLIFQQLLVKKLYQPKETVNNTLEGERMA